VRRRNFGKEPDSRTRTVREERRARDTAPRTQTIDRAALPGARRSHASTGKQPHMLLIPFCVTAQNDTTSVR